MPNVLDVAAYILKRQGPVTAMKLQKLVYYCQAWSIVWDDEALFDEEIEAWQLGPVVRELYDAHRGQYRVENLPRGNPDALSKAQKSTVKAVLKFYGGKNAQYLSDLTHLEQPWNAAWEQGQNTVITLESLGEYYSNIEPPSGKEA